MPQKVVQTVPEARPSGAQEGSRVLHPLHNGVGQARLCNPTCWTFGSGVGLAKRQCKVVHCGITFTCSDAATKVFFVERTVLLLISCGHCGRVAGRRGHCGSLSTVKEKTCFAFPAQPLPGSLPLVQTAHCLTAVRHRQIAGDDSCIAVITSGVCFGNRCRSIRRKVQVVLQWGEGGLHSRLQVTPCQTDEEVLVGDPSLRRRRKAHFARLPDRSRSGRVMSGAKRGKDVL